jgi:hypothetical protein
MRNKAQGAFSLRLFISRKDKAQRREGRNTTDRRKKCPKGIAKTKSSILFLSPSESDDVNYQSVKRY